MYTRRAERPNDCRAPPGHFSVGKGFPAAFQPIDVFSVSQAREKRSGLAGCYTLAENNFFSMANATACARLRT